MLLKKEKSIEDNYTYRIKRLIIFEFISKIYSDNAYSYIIIKLYLESCNVFKYSTKRSTYIIVVNLSRNERNETGNKVVT